MNISRRSLVFSFILHTSLVLAGTVWLLLAPQRGAALTPSQTETQRFAVTPVALSRSTPEAVPANRAQPQKRPSASRVPARPNPAARPAPEPAPGDVPHVVKAAAQQPATVAKARPLGLPAAYPTANVSQKPSASPRGEVKPGRRQQTSAPLWTPPTESVATPTPGPESASAGGGEGEAQVSEPTPLGLIDPGAQVSSFAALNSGYVEVEFEISAEGETTKVTLVKATGVSQVDADLLAYFRTFRWNPQTVGGSPVAGRQSMDFQVEKR